MEVRAEGNTVYPKYQNITDWCIIRLKRGQNGCICGIHFFSNPTMHPNHSGISWKIPMQMVTLAILRISNRCRVQGAARGCNAPLRKKMLYFVSWKCIIARVRVYITWKLTWKVLKSKFICLSFVLFLLKN